MLTPRSVLIALLLGAASGCASIPETQVNVVKPGNYAIPNTTVTVPQSRATTWDWVVSRLAKSPFVVEKIDGRSFFAKVSQPANGKSYVDCGKRTINDDGQIFRFNNTDKQYRYTVYRSGHRDTYRIRTAVTGQADIFVTGNESNSKVTVKPAFLIVVDEDFSSTQSPALSKTKTHTLKLASGKTDHFSPFQSTCQSTGRFEAEIMEQLMAHRFKH